ncbi:MAG: TraB/GumN family protein [Candidatus Thermoplasmatota archaeon]
MDEIRDGVVLVGTAHISATSVAEVESVIRARRPAKVLVELDPGRLVALRDPEAWKRTDLFQILRAKKQHLFLLQLYLSAMQAQMGRQTGVKPGAELLRAIEVAEEVGAQVVLIDREVRVTLKRGFSSMGLWARLRLFWNVWMQLLTPADKNAKPFDVDALLETDAITRMTDEFARFAPDIKVALIDERDAVMASHIEEESRTGTVVAVVGAGHVPGMKRFLAAPATIPPRAPLLEMPPRRVGLGTFLAIAVPVVLAAAVAGYAVNGRYEEILAYGRLWILLHVAFAGAGALIALGHPLAALTGGLAAPFTSVLPTGLKSGWLAGMVQARQRKPTVGDFEAIKTIERLRDFWTNGVVRVLTVTAMTNLGSIAAKVVFFANILPGAF